EPLADLDRVRRRGRRQSPNPLRQPTYLVCGAGPGLPQIDLPRRKPSSSPHDLDEERTPRHGLVVSGDDVAYGFPALLDPEHLLPAGEHRLPRRQLEPSP